MRARGMERRVAQPSVLTPRKQVYAVCATCPRLWRRRALRRRARHSALHGGDFCPRGRNFRARTGGLRPPRSGQLSPPFVRAASSHQRQSPIVGTDGDPGPPGDGVTSPARRRGASRCRACPTSAPFSGSIFETSREDALSRARRPGL